MTQDAGPGLVENWPQSGYKTACMVSSAPIFVIGSYRSATSATTWAIGQHPNIFPLEETNFISRMSVDLAIQHKMGSARGSRTFLSSARISRRDYYRHFGCALDKLILDSRQALVAQAKEESTRSGSTSQNVKLEVSAEAPKNRWIDGTPENSHVVLALRLMYPNAKFIFILRDPREVARSLAHFESIGGGTYSEQESYNLWIHLVRSCALAERAFGSSVVLRVRYEDIKENPADVVRRCLEFVGEPFCEACLNPFRERINASAIPANAGLQGGVGTPKYLTEAVALYESIASGDFERTHTPFKAYRTLAEAFVCYRKTFEFAEIRALSRKNRYLSTKLRQANARIEARLGSLVRRVRRVFRRSGAGHR